MPLDGNGNYNRAVSQAVAGTTIQAAYYNTEQNDIGATLGQMLPRDGQASMTGPFRLPDGNAAVPAFAFNGEASSGLFRPGTGVLAFSVLAGERMRLLSNGNLIIGSTSDGGQKLQVTGTAAITSNTTVGGTLGVTGAATLSSTLGVTGATTLSSTLGVTGVATLTRLVNNAPNAASAFNDLAINGTVYGYIGDRTGVLGSGSGLSLRSEGVLYFGAGGGSERLRIDTSGVATFTGAIAVSAGSAAPLTITQSSGSNAAITLTRSDVGFTATVANNGSTLVFSHRPNFGANTALDTGNYNSYAPTLTGTGASGTWSISVTGSASNNVLKSGDTMSGNLTFNNYGLGHVGVYDSTKYQAVFSMGAAYTPAADGSSLSNLYGIAWSHTNAGGQTKSGLGHQALFVSAGTTRTAIGDGIWTAGHVTLNNGNVYVNTNGNAFVVSSGAYIRNSSGSYGSLEVVGTTGGYAGLFLGSASTYAPMYDTSGNGGAYNTAGEWHYYWNNSDNCLGIGGSTTSSSYKCYVSGALYASGDITAFSDRRAKTNFSLIDSALEKVSKLAGYTYTWATGSQEGKRSTGLIAQDVEKVLPEAVHTGEDDKKGVNYNGVIALLVEAVKELKAEVAMLKGVPA